MSSRKISSTMHLFFYFIFAKLSLYIKYIYQGTRLCVLQDSYMLSNDSIKGIRRAYSIEH